MFAVTWKIGLVIGVWIAVFCALMALHQLDASYGAELSDWVQIPGAVAILFGAVGVLYCGALLSHVGVFTQPGANRLLPRRFLVTGPFRFTRNPMSLAGVTLLVGIALWNRSLLGLMVAALVFVVMHLFITLVEEPGLERRFGDSYRAYKRQVPRWRPKWRSLKTGD